MKNCSVYHIKAFFWGDRSLFWSIRWSSLFQFSQLQFIFSAVTTVMITVFLIYKFYYGVTQFSLQWFLLLHNWRWRRSSVYLASHTLTQPCARCVPHMSDTWENIYFVRKISIFQNMNFKRRNIFIAADPNCMSTDLVIFMLVIFQISFVFSANISYHLHKPDKGTFLCLIFL